MFRSFLARDVTLKIKRTAKSNCSTYFYIYTTVFIQHLYSNNNGVNEKIVYKKLRLAFKRNFFIIIQSVSSAFVYFYYYFFF